MASPTLPPVLPPPQLIHDGTTVHHLLELFFPSLPDIEDIREIVLNRPQARGCILRCACHREDCPICLESIRETVGGR
jgi:hypothetical protein